VHSVFASDGTRGHCARVGAFSVPRIHARTALWEQNEKSAVRTLCPTPGTTISRPCENWFTTDRAFATGVRMSNPPSTASTGTFGYGPGPSGVLPAGDGHCSQKYAVPSRAAQLPKGPVEPGARPAIAALIAARRCAGGVPGVHGNCPSAQFVAALSAKLRSSAASWLDLRSR